MADMITFNGVPVVTYGLTGLMIAVLTTMTFVDTKGQSSAIVATASVPSLVSNFLTPSAPSFIESVTNKPSIMESLTSTPSIMESIVGKNEEPSIMESIVGNKEEPSIMESIVGNKEEPSILASIVGEKEEPSMLEKITTPIAGLVDEDEGYIQRKGGSTKKNNKKKRRIKNTLKSR